MITPTEAWRKLIHMPGALGPPVAITLFGWKGSVAILLFITAYVVAGALALRRGQRLPIIAALIDRSRRADEAFPVAPLEYLLAILLLGAFFQDPWFFAAIAVLAIGDGIAALVGLAWGRHKLPWNRRKSWAGLGAGLLVAPIAAGLFFWIGSWTREEGFAVSPILGAPWAVPAFLAVGFLVFWAVARGLVGADLVPRSATARPWLTVAVALLCFFVGAAVYLVPVHSPLVPGIGEDLPLWIPAAPALLVMFIESFLRRHDNLILPVTYVSVGYGLILATAAYSW